MTLSTIEKVESRVSFDFSTDNFPQNTVDRAINFIETCKKQRNVSNRDDRNGDKVRLMVKFWKIQGRHVDRKQLLTSNIHSATILRMSGEMSLCTHSK